MAPPTSSVFRRPLSTVSLTLCPICPQDSGWRPRPPEKRKGTSCLSCLCLSVVLEEKLFVVDSLYL